jgi:membrane-bound lytic murein transglycosylase D
MTKRFDGFTLGEDATRRPAKRICKEGKFGGKTHRFALSEFYKWFDTPEKRVLTSKLTAEALPACAIVPTAFGSLFLSSSFFIKLFCGCRSRDSPVKSPSWIRSNLLKKGERRQMTTSLPRFITHAALVAAFILPAAGVHAQISAGSSARNIPSEVEKSEGRIAEIISRAEDHFKRGKLNLDDNKRDQAREEFDKAVDTVLESGMDVRSSQRLQTFYLELVERIYREEVPQSLLPGQSINTATVVAQNSQTVTPGADAVNARQPQGSTPRQVGFREQKFEPSPLDELSKLTLTPEEQNVSPQDTADLELAKNNIDFGFNVNPLIQQFINYYQGRGRSTMETGLRRSGRFMRIARQIFREEGVPEDITWLGQVESAWRPAAYSSAAASGLWQFVPSTGARFGLRQTAWIDERNGIDQATRASAKYLKWLANRYGGNWELAMAAYNTGEGNVDRAIGRAGTMNFWSIYPYIAQETRNYVPNILATILIAKNPEKYGFHSVRPEPAMAYDKVWVPTATSLQLIADACDTSVDYLRSLNPELRRDLTPRGEGFQVRVPAGRAKQFVALLKRIPSNARETARIISIAPGEDLPSFAARTGTSLAQLQMMNGGVDMKAGGKLVVPNNYARNVALVRAKPQAAAASQTRSLISVRAMRGDTIAKLAARFNASADEVARLNGVAAEAELQPGQQVRVPSASAQADQPSAPASRRRRR